VTLCVLRLQSDNALEYDYGESSHQLRATMANPRDNDPQVDGVPTHYTREPLWLVPLGGIAVALVPFLRPGKFLKLASGVGIVNTMLMLGLFGAVASALLVGRSHIRSTFWSNVVLWLGILMIALGVCAAAIVFSG
jgi:hypothetical protein